MKIGTIRGIEIDLHYSTLVIIGLVGFYAANFYNQFVSNPTLFELIIVGIINGVILLLSILAHELMHSFVAQEEGMEVPKITFYLFGGVSSIDEEPKSPMSEFKIAAVGPVSSLIIGGSLLISLFVPTIFLEITYPSILAVTLLYMGISNIALGIFNFLPAFPMDGGRVLRSYLWHKKDNNLIDATKTASKVGKYFGYGMVAYGFFQMFFLGLFGGLWMVVIGWFLANSAKQAVQQTIMEVRLKEMKAKDMMHKYDVNVPAEITVNEAIKDYFMPYRRAYFPVTRHNQTIGILHAESVRDIPNERRDQVKVEEIMRENSDIPVVGADEPGNEVLKKLKRAEEEPRIVRITNGETEVLGFVDKNDIRSALEVSRLFS